MVIVTVIVLRSPFPDFETMPASPAYNMMPHTAVHTHADGFLIPPTLHHLRGEPGRPDVSMPRETYLDSVYHSSEERVKQQTGDDTHPLCDVEYFRVLTINPNANAHVFV